MEEKIIISLGGSIINPGEINLAYLKKFRDLILKQKNKKFYIVTGGGAPVRHYQEIIRKIQKDSIQDEDAVGIAATRLNAQFLRAMFGKKAAAEIFYSPYDLPKEEAKVFIGGGYLPGNSSDLVAAVLAKEVGAKTVLNLSNIDYVYDKDPRTHKEAKPQKQIAWKEFLKIVGNKWTPGGNFPFDPIAAKFAATEGMKVVVMNGKKLVNLKKYLENGTIRGTLLN